MPPVLGIRQHSQQPRRITRQLVGDHHPRLAAGRGDHTPKERFGRVLITPWMHQEVEYDAMRVNRSPQPMALAFDLALYLVQLPFVTRVCTPSPQSRCLGWAELGALGADRLVSDGHSALSQQLLDVTQAQAESLAEPHRMADDLGRVPIPTIR